MASTKTNTIVMTEGRPLPQVIRFAIPLALTGILQLLFNAADVIVVGKFDSSTALAAVGATTSLINLLIGAFIGISVGVNILVARYLGCREDERVRVFERTNIKTAVPAELGAPFDIVVADLSFIGLAGLADVFAALCAPGTVCLLLVKPQFESAHDETDRGIVRDESVRLRVVKEVSDAFAAVGFSIEGAVESPIKGAEGNVEYLVKAVYQAEVACREPEARCAR